eukprot:m.8234 g.8234  ORF g.8234 m.8234 type:complete len:261 (-) comp4039_c0_seq1:75-857(-)
MMRESTSTEPQAAAAGGAHDPPPLEAWGSMNTIASPMLPTSGNAFAEPLIDDGDMTPTITAELPSATVVSTELYGTVPWDEDTLDEPVLTTIHRDLKNVGLKCFYVLVPHKSKRLLHDWDLWGPLILTMTLASLLRTSGRDDKQRTEMFAGVFFIICVGSAVVTMNSKLLGARLSFFQSVCVIGYCLMPLLLACILLRTLKLVYTHLAIRLIVVALAFAWSVYASVGFIGSNADDNRRALIIYPVFLFFLVIAWLIVNDA